MGFPGFCLDEAYEFLEGLGLMGTTQKGEGGKTATLNASSLNRLIQAGNHKRGTRTGTSSTTSRPPPVNLSVCGNLHPSKAISMERQLQGNHVAACKERFIFCCDRSTPRHAECLGCRAAALESTHARLFIKCLALFACLLQGCLLITSRATQHGHGCRSRHNRQ